MRNVSFILAVVLGAYALPSAAQTEAHDSAFYVTPLVQGVRTDGDRSLDDGAAFTLAAGFRPYRHWDLELNLFRGRFDGAGGGDLQMDAAGVNALRVFRREARVSPYVLFGAGSVRKDWELGGSSRDPYADAGAGLLAQLRRSEDTGRALLLRVDLRARHDDGGNRLDHLFGVGLQYVFGARSPGRTAAAVTPPATPPPPAAPPAAAEVRGNDGDGVPEEVQLPTVTFAFDSDRLSPAAIATLDRAIATLRSNPDVHVEIAGHADSLGPDAYNLALSQRRAEAVRRYLVDNGVTNMLTVRGYGSRDPIAHNGTPAGRAQNRRVVLRVLSQ